MAHDGMTLAKPNPHGSFSDSLALTHCICWGSAFKALHAIPDGWAKVDGEWIQITSDGVGYGEFDRCHIGGSAVTDSSSSISKIAGAAEDSLGGTSP